MGSFWREGHQKSMSVASGTRLAEGGGGGVGGGRNSARGITPA